MIHVDPDRELVCLGVDPGFATTAEARGLYIVVSDPPLRCSVGGPEGYPSVTIGASGGWDLIRGSQQHRLRLKSHSTHGLCTWHIVELVEDPHLIHSPLKSEVVDLYARRGN